MESLLGAEQICMLRDSDTCGTKINVDIKEMKWIYLKVSSNTVVYISCSCVITWQIFSVQGIRTA